MGSIGCRGTRLAAACALVLGVSGCGEAPLAPHSEGPPIPLLSMHGVVDCDDTADLRARISALEADGTLTHGQATALRSKIEQAERWDREGRPEMAADALARLLAQVGMWIAEGALSEEEAADLVACAEDVADGPDEEFVLVSAGDRHTCALTSSGRALCWGDNEFGQLGDGTDTRRTSPVPVVGDHTFASLTAGGFHSCGLTADGQALCWGRNAFGALGDGSTVDASAPVPVGGGHTFVDIDAGALSTCGVADGVTLCWGHNASGQLGDGSTVDRLLPVAVAGSDALHPFTEVDAGGLHACGLTSAGQGWCWGENGQGQLGDGTFEGRQVPVAVAGGFVFSDISAGRIHTCGVTTVGAHCWGQNDSGQLGNGGGPDPNTPDAVLGGHDFAQVDAGDDHSCGVTTDGEAWCWGRNDTGGLGIGTIGGFEHPEPVAVTGGIDFAHVTVGDLEHTCGLATAGEVYCWGTGLFGALGNGTTDDSAVPIAVPSP